MLEYYVNPFFRTRTEHQSDECASFLLQFNYEINHDKNANMGMFCNFVHCRIAKIDKEMDFN